MTQAFNLSQFANNVNTSGQASLTAAVSGTLPVANGGTGTTSLTANNVILGNGTGAVQAVAPSTSGNVLTSNGTTWISAAGASSNGNNIAIFYSSGTWTPPTGITSFMAFVIGAGGGGGAGSGSVTKFKGGTGGPGGTISFAITNASGSYTVTIGAGGSGSNSTAGAAGGTSSLTGTNCSASCTGGGGGAAAVSSNGATGTGGAGTVSTGTPITNETLFGIGTGATTTLAGQTASFTVRAGVGGTGETGGSDNNALGGAGGQIVITW